MFEGLRGRITMSEVDDDEVEDEWTEENEEELCEWCGSEPCTCLEHAEAA